MNRIHGGLKSADLYDLIHLQPEIAHKLEVIGSRMDISQIETYLVRMMDMGTAQQSYQELKAILKEDAVQEDADQEDAVQESADREDADHLRMLYCQLECARRLFARYQEKQIPENIYADTMRCFTRFIEECKVKNGRMFFDRGWWTYRQISMDIFRIGALEYQFKEYEGEKVIGLHIPSDADLSCGSVDASLRQADLFFETYYGKYEYRRYTCNSWLMSPVLRPLLSQGSNILSFQNRFDIVRGDREDKEYIEWLFRVPVDTDGEDLPAKTSLQKKVKELILQGGNVGSALGIMNRE